MYFKKAAQLPLYPSAKENNYIKRYNFPSTSLANASHLLFTHIEGEVIEKPTRLALINSVYLVGDVALALTKKRFPIAPPYHDEHRLPVYRAKWLFFNSFSGTETVFDHACSLVTLYSKKKAFNYSHWLQDSISVLLTLKRDVAEFNEIKILIPSDLNIQQRQLIISIGVNPDNIIEWCYKKAYIKNLYLIRNLKVQRGKFVITHSEVLASFTELSKRLANSKYSHSRLLISRRGERAYYNRADLESVVQQYQLKEVFLEDVSFIEQVSFFHFAEVIVAIHGAGLTNLFFASKAHVIEVYSKIITGYIQHYLFYSICLTKGLPHTALWDKDVINEEGIHQVNIDSRALDQALQKAIT